jgi:hypothetical protein
LDGAHFAFEDFLHDLDVAGYGCGGVLFSVDFLDEFNFAFDYFDPVWVCVAEYELQVSGVVFDVFGFAVDFFDKVLYGFFLVRLSKSLTCSCRLYKLFSYVIIALRTVNYE